MQIAFKLLQLILFLYFALCVVLCPACVSVSLLLGICTGMQYLQRQEDGVGFLGSGFIGGCEPPCGYGELNSAALQEQQALTAEAHLYSPLTKRFMVNF